MIIGMTRRPTSSITATKAETFARVMPRIVATSPAETLPPAEIWPTTGSSTSATTITRSSTTSQPTAIRPRSVSSRRLSPRARVSTTVLATDRARPKTMPAWRLQPRAQAKAMPISVATAICTTAPGTAMLRTDIRSFSEKCSPTANIRRMTPISASSAASSASATKPGVKGPTATPAIR
ncbi:hypothetical protein ROTAS13_01969 [Roseomonas sp. TAS13]|nr:hypothetical protein ROTAS13_01969 [Roseomonas sp. TAS13]